MIHPGRPAIDAAWPQFERCAVGDELAALGVVGLRQQRRHRHIGEIRVPVPGLAVGKGELGAFHDRVDKFLAHRVHGGEVKAREQRHLLEEGRALAPGAAFEDGVALVFVGERRFDGGLPAGHVLCGYQPGMAAAGGVECAAAHAAMDEKEFYNFSIQKNNESKNMIYKTLDQYSLPYTQSHANFVFFKSGVDITEFGKKMMQHNIRVGRPFKPLLDWCRISTGKTEEMQAVVNALQKIYA